MSLSCLICQPSPSHSPYSASHSPNCRCRCCPALDRSWSGGITPPPYSYFGRSQSTKGRMEIDGKGGHRKMRSTGGPFRDMDQADGKDEPRLVRSGGMRRDWSFENLQARAKHVPRNK